MAKKKDKGKAARGTGCTERTPLTIQAGDIVSHLGTDYVVQSRLVYDEEGFKWFEYLLEDGPSARFLRAEMEDRLELQLVGRVDDLELPLSEQPPEVIEYRGARYRLGERGFAKVTREGGGAGAAGSESCRYWDYLAPGGKVLSIEKWGDSYQVKAGEEIRTERLLEICPGGE